MQVWEIPQKDLVSVFFFLIASLASFFLFIFNVIWNPVFRSYWFGGWLRLGSAKLHSSNNKNNDSLLQLIISYCCLSLLSRLEGFLVFQGVSVCRCAL